MIYAFTGKTGSGKTYRMVQDAYHKWRRGVDVYSNTILFFGNKKLNWVEKILCKLKIQKAERGKITYFEDISEILEAKDGIILFDEAQVLFSARQWEKLSDDFIYKLQQHRKHKLDLYCTTQNMGTIDIMYRRLVQRWFHHECIFQIGKSMSFLGLFKIKEKDIDLLYNSVDDLQVPDIKVNYFLIHKFKRRLYDTFYDIGFKAYKSVCLVLYNQNNQKNEMISWIIPKKMSLRDAQRCVSTMKSAYGLNRSNRILMTKNNYEVNI